MQRSYCREKKCVRTGHTTPEKLSFWQIEACVLLFGTFYNILFRFVKILRQISGNPQKSGNSCSKFSLFR